MDHALSGGYNLWQDHSKSAQFIDAESTMVEILEVTEIILDQCKLDLWSWLHDCAW